MQASPFDRHGSVIAAIALATAGVAMFMVEPLFLGALARYRGFSNSQIGQLAAVELVGSSFVAVSAVFWVHRVNWRIVATLALLIGTAGNLLSSYVTDFAPLLVLRLGTAFFGLGVAYTLGIAAISRCHAPDKKFAYLVVTQVSYGALALYFLPPLIERWGLAGIVWPVAMIPLMTLGFVAFLPAGDKQTGSDKHPDTPRPTAEHWPVFLVLLVHVIWYAGIGGIWAFFELLGSEAGLQSAAIGEALAIGMAASIGGALLASALGLRLGRLLPFCLALLVQLAAILLLFDSSRWSMFLLACIGFNLGWNLGLPFLLGLIAKADRRGTLVVLIPAAQGFGVGVGPVIAGILADKGGLDWVVAFACVAVSVSLVLYIPLARYIAQRE